MKIVVIGGSGLIGSSLVGLLRGRGHEAVAASPSTGVDALTGKGLDVALAGAEVAVDAPRNGIIEVAGPDPIRMDELARRFLDAQHDSRTVITDDTATYFGTPVNDQSLTPGDGPLIGPTRFDDWLGRLPRKS